MPRTSRPDLLGFRLIYWPCASISLTAYFFFFFFFFLFFLLFRCCCRPATASRSTPRLLAVSTPHTDLSRRDLNPAWGSFESLAYQCGVTPPNCACTCLSSTLFLVTTAPRRRGPCVEIWPGVVGAGNDLQDRGNSWHWGGIAVDVLRQGEYRSCA